MNGSKLSKLVTTEPVRKDWVEDGPAKRKRKKKKRPKTSHTAERKEHCKALERR